MKYTQQPNSSIPLLAAGFNSAVLSFLFIFVSVTLHAAPIYWIDGTASYNDPSRWNSNAVPGAGDNAINDNGTGNAVQVNPGDPAWSVVDPLAGTVANTGGAFELNGSELNVGGWMRLSLASNSSSIFTITDGTLNLPNRLQTGEGPNSSTIVNINGGLIKKPLGGLGFNFSDGGWGGQHSATTMVTQTAGTIEMGGELWIGQFNGGVATYDMSGGTINASNWFVVARDHSRGTLNMTGGTINKHAGGGGGAQAFIVGDWGVADVNHSGGTIASTTQYWIGQGADARATNNMSGTAKLTVNDWIAVGRENSYGELNISDSASITKTSSGNSFVIAGVGAPTGIINQTGGAVTNTVSDTWLAESGTGVWTLDDGLAMLGYLQIARNGGSIGTFNLNGGTLSASEITTGGGTGTLNLNGGTLRASADNPDWLHGNGETPLNVEIQAGGVTLESDYDIGISSSLLDNFSTGGAFTKTGTGTAQLNGFSFWSGTTTVEGGKLILSTDSFVSGAIDVADGAGVGVAVVVDEASLFPASLTLGTSGATSVDFDLGAFGNPSQAPIDVSFGTLAVNGMVTVNIADALPQVGQFPLIAYGSRTGSGNFVLGDLPTGVSATIGTNGNSIVLDITGVTVVRWNGNVNGNWDIASTANWINNGTGLGTTYTDGNPTILNDLASGTTSINLTTTVNPNGVTVDIDNLPYTLSGAGKISGPEGLTKRGTNVLTINNTGGNDYTGETVIDEGTIDVDTLSDVGQPSSIGAATNVVLSGGTLRYSGAPVSVNRGVAYSSTNNAIETVGDLTLTGPLSPDSDARFHKKGTGTLTYAQTGTNQLSTAGGNGSYNVENGTVVLDGTGGAQLNRVTGQLFVGATTNSGAALEVNSSVLQVNDWLAVGRANGSVGHVSSLTLNDGHVRAPSSSFGYNNDDTNTVATQVLTLNGASTYTNNGVMHLGERRGSTLTVAINDSASLHCGGDFNLAGSGGANATLTMNGTSTFYTQNRAHLGWHSNVAGRASASLTLSDSAQMRANAWFAIGHEGGQADMVVQDTASLSIRLDLNVTDVGPSAGYLTVKDDALVLANNIFVGKDTNSVAVLTITNNASVISSNGLTMGQRWNGPAVKTDASVNLDGGSLAVNLVQGRDYNGTNQGVFNFNGGTLIARNPLGGDFMFNLNAINVQPGGAVIDSDVHTIAISQALLNAGGGLTKIGSGTLLLNGVNTYTGTTLVNEGTLGGAGTIAGPVTVGASGAIAPATSLGILTINNTLGLGGDAVMEISRDAGAPESDRINGITTLTCGGTLTVVNIGTNALQVNDTFFLFNAGTISGTFAALDLPAGYAWDTSNLYVNGTIRVDSIVSAGATMNVPVLSGGNVILTGTDGSPGAGYTLLTSTNAGIPVSNWETNLTDTFDGSGAFSNAIPYNPAEPQRYFNVRTP